MKYIKEYFEALFAMLAFKTFTIYPRWFEIYCGWIAWICIGIIIWGQLK